MAEDKGNSNPLTQPDVAPDAAAEPVPDDSGAAAGPTETHAELERLKDQVLRAQAEAENTRRRAARDVENAHKYALEKFAAELLPVLDSLEKAAETSAETQGAEAIGEGVELCLKLFVTTLEKFGIEQLDPLGEPFDPQQHEAMAMVPNPDAEPNSVMEVMQKGYTLNGRLVRAAKVIVVKANDTSAADPSGNRSGDGVDVEA